MVDVVVLVEANDIESFLFADAVSPLRYPFLFIIVSTRRAWQKCNCYCRGVCWN
jgi:hypothetical protein